MVLSVNPLSIEKLSDLKGGLACRCNHCQKIRKQQEESELRWIKQHQLFDR